MSRILLTGVNGQLGFELAKTLAPLGVLYAVTRAEFDLTDSAMMAAVLAGVAPDIIVNPAAYTAVDRAEGDEAAALAVNAEAAGWLARWAAEHEVLLVHYSTDYVFDGQQSHAYREEDTANPQSVYGRSKWQGEQAIRAAVGPHWILRTSWVFGQHGRNFVKTMLRLAQAQEALRVVDDQFGAPTSALLIAEVTARMIQQYQAQGGKVPLGTYHLAAGGRTHWCDYARYILAGARARGAVLKAETVRAICTADYPSPARRPANACLDCRKLSRDFAIDLPLWQPGVDRVLDQLLGPL